VNFDDYQSKYFAIYQDFAGTVRFILEQALKADAKLPRPQSIQSRAKTPDSLRRRLSEQDKLNTTTLETDRRDLSGARIIFYTNNDVDSFLSSDIIRENFEIVEDSVKVHHPTPENKGTQYRAIHYTVKLQEERTRLPEYARFAGLRCEIQVQTILNHAYSETSHDITYKGAIGGDGFGSRAMKGIQQRFERIMNEHLVPAGYEIQKAQQEYERLLEGKELFDTNVGKSLESAKDNNERYEILSKLKDYALPNYDDYALAFQSLREPLLATVKAARNTPQKPIETTFGSLDGFKAGTVIEQVVEIISRIRYADVTGVLQLLIDIYRDEPDEGIRRQIENAVKSLAKYNLDAYKQVGPGIQSALVDLLADMDAADLDAIRPIALSVWREAIQSDITGSKWRASSVTLSSGSVPDSEQLRSVRHNAMKALFAAYDRSTDDAQRRQVFSALDAASRTPNQGMYSNELLATTLRDAKRIVDFAKDRASTMSFPLIQHLEHSFLYDYFRAVGIADDPEKRFASEKEAKELIDSIFAFKDAVNADAIFVKYKVLVGFESVYPQHWISRNFDYQEEDRYRRAEADRYIEEANDANEADLRELIERSAATKSDDMATFPVFGQFISNLSERKPEVAERMLADASEELRRFLAGFLNGFSRSNRADIYDRVIAEELQSARNLVGVARHLRYSDIAAPDRAEETLARSIKNEDIAAVNECLLFAIEHFGPERIPEPDQFVNSALRVLNAKKNYSWVWNGWFLQNVAKFYDAMTEETLGLVLESLRHLPKVDHQVERILIRLAERWPEPVWDYLDKRLDCEVSEGEEEERFEAVPFSFHGLEEELSKHPELGIKKGLARFKRDPSLFQFRGGRLLSSAFPGCTPEFAAALVSLIKNGAESEADFVLQIFQNYTGEIPTHVVLKEIVAKFPEDKRRMGTVGVCIDNTGVVSGNLGFAEAWRAKKQTMVEWLEDDRPIVRAFAENHIRTLDRMITDETRRAEADKEMWELGFHDDDDDSDSDGVDPPVGPTGVM
jgi:ppGpp synthetase/RelA/SpoT-type nucleotidyltranferase